MFHPTTNILHNVNLVASVWLHYIHTPQRMVCEISGSSRHRVCDTKFTTKRNSNTLIIMVILNFIKMLHISILLDILFRQLTKQTLLSDICVHWFNISIWCFILILFIYIYFKFYILFVSVKVLAYAHTKYLV